MADATPTAMIAPISEGTLSVVPVMNSMVRMPHSVAGSARMTTKRIAESLVVHDHQQIDEHGGEQQADAEVHERAIHALDLADDLNRVAGLELLLQLRHDLADLARRRCRDRGPCMLA